MLDLKGRSRALPARLERALADCGRPVFVCSQNWSLLEPFRHRDGIRVVHSVGSRRTLALLLRRFAGERLGGVSIHRELLDARTVASLRELAALVLSWPVATVEQARQLAAWGVDGLISERFDTIGGALAPAVLAA